MHRGNFFTLPGMALSCRVRPPRVGTNTLLSMPSCRRVSTVSVSSRAVRAHHRSENDLVTDANRYPTISADT